jgi:hypothetical protein
MNKILLGLMAFFFVGCTSPMLDTFLGNPEDITLSTFKAASDQSYPPYQGEVKLLKSTPKGSVVIGRVRIADDTYDWDDLIADMKERAAKQGANALVITQKKEEKKEEGSETELGDVRASHYRMYYEKQMEGIALKIPE